MSSNSSQQHQCNRKVWFEKLNEVLCEGSSLKDAIRKQNYQPRRPSYFISKTPEQEALEMDKTKKQRQTRIMSIQEGSQYPFLQFLHLRKSYGP